MDEFFDYYQGKTIGYALSIDNLQIFQKPIQPEKVKENFTAPQSFCYV